MADVPTPERPPSIPDFGQQFNSTTNLVELEKKEPLPDGPPDYKSGPPPSYFTSMSYEVDPEMVKTEVKSGALPKVESYRMHLILSCVVTWLCFIVFGAIAFVLTIFARRRSSKGESKVAGQFATASLILSVVGIVVGIAIWGVIIWAAVDASASCSKYECGGECWEYVTTHGMEDGCRNNFDSYCYNEETNECFSNVQQGSMNCSNSNMSSSTTPAPCAYTCNGECYNDYKEMPGGDNSECSAQNEISCYNTTTGVCYFGAYSAGGGDGSGLSSSTMTSSRASSTPKHSSHSSTSSTASSSLKQSSPSAASSTASSSQQPSTSASQSNTTQLSNASSTTPYDGPYMCNGECYLMSTTYEKSCGGGGGGMDDDWCSQLFGDDSCMIATNCYYNPPGSSSETIGPYLCKLQCYVYREQSDSEDTCYSQHVEACYIKFKAMSLCFYN